jgi:hypothetical protein
MAGGSLGPAVSTAAAARACGADVTFFDASDFAAGFRALARSDLATARQGQLTEIIGHTIADEAIGRQADLVVALAQAPLHAAALRVLVRRELPRPHVLARSGGRLRSVLCDSAWHVSRPSS